MGPDNSPLDVCYVEVTRHEPRLTHHLARYLAKRLFFYPVVVRRDTFSACSDLDICDDSGEAKRDGFPHGIFPPKLCSGT